MEYTTIPNTTLKVSRICLGSMTWGQQNTETEGHAQLDYALENGVNFIDTAEMYSVPGREETQGSTERIIGTWLAKRHTRKDVILASKIAGPSPIFKYIREPLDFSKKALEDALHKSLKRLQTDYLDLYQLHWPERSVNVFGQRDFKWKPDEAWEDNFAAILDHLSAFVKEGKIRYAGLSNETPYGAMRYAELARHGKLKMVSIQNAYSLLNRRDEAGLTEVLHRENIGYLPYSPLAFGVLTGKYRHGALPKNTRLALFPNYNRYHSKNSLEAAEAYHKIAEKYHLNFAQMALAFVRQQPFVTSTIIGATTLPQLKENIASSTLTLSGEVLEAIEAVHNLLPNPAP